MPTASSLALFQRIEEVLVDGRGVARTIAPEHRFRRGMPTDVEPGSHAAQALVRKTVIAAPLSTRRPQYPAGRPTHDFPVRIQVVAYYSIGNVVNAEHVRRVSSTMLDDVNRVVAALEQPGNLATTEAGDDTGLASGALRFETWSLDRFDTGEGLAAGAWIFEGAIALIKPT